MSDPSAPTLTRARGSARPEAAVLMLHGGKERSAAPVDGRSASWRRSRAMQRSVSGRLAGGGVDTWLLAYRHRGWNGGAPVLDARWALDRMRGELGALPVVLLGHSMGARTAVHAADDPSVRGVVALAPWFPPGEPVAALRSRHLVAAHGRRDRITSFAATAAYVERAQAVGTARMVDMGPLGHYLLKGARAWNDLAVDAVLEVLERS